MTILIAAASAFAGYAQTAYDAFLFSENNYEGTARTMAMGDAFTALGGDLGSISINPAGSAVAKYSQFTITPSLTFTTCSTQGVSPYSDGSLPYFENQFNSRNFAAAIPNIGLTFSWESGRTSGLKSFTFGFIANRLNSWNQDIYAAGTNNTTSFMGSMAAGATSEGYLGSELNANDAFDYYPGRYVVGYQSGMISTFNGQDNQFIGASEVLFNNNGNTEIAVGGPLEQTYGRLAEGVKNEYVVNFGVNISDFLYLGANLGITSMNYSYEEYFKESAVDPSDFSIEYDDGSKTYFNNMRYNYDYMVETSGIYGKFGFILTPGAGIRIGAAIQTPVATTVNEEWKHSGETHFSNGSYSSTSPWGSDSYSFREPWKANIGLGWTLGQNAIISADYEMCDYGSMRFVRDGLNDGREYFEDINNDIRTVYGTSHALRVGAEIKLGAVAVRGGYGITSSPEKATILGEELSKMSSQNASIGLGYNSKKSFFADIAARYAFATKEYFMPYDDYMYDNNDNLVAFAPEILNKTSALKVMLTLGWRF